LNQKYAADSRSFETDTKLTSSRLWWSENVDACESAVQLLIYPGQSVRKRCRACKIALRDATTWHRVRAILRARSAYRLALCEQKSRRGLRAIGQILPLSEE